MSGLNGESWLLSLRKSGSKDEEQENEEREFKGPSHVSLLSAETFGWINQSKRDETAGTLRDNLYQAAMKEELRVQA